MHPIPALSSGWGFRPAGARVWMWFVLPETNIDGSRPPRLEWVYVFPENAGENPDRSRAVVARRARDVVRVAEGKIGVLEWTRGPGCYRLALANHRRRWAGLMPKVCIKEPPAAGSPPVAQADLVPQGIELKGKSDAAAVEIFRLEVSSPETFQPTDDPTAWPWEPLQVVKPDAGTWRWVDASAAEGRTYAYLCRNRKEKTASLWISGAGVVLGPLTFRDVFPPPPPARLELTEAPDALVLNWPAVSAPDLQGYRIYIRDDRRPEWRLFTPEPVPITRYRIPRERLREVLRPPSAARWIEFQVRSQDNKTPPNIGEDGPTVRYQPGKQSGGGAS